MNRSYALNPVCHKFISNFRVFSKNREFDFSKFYCKLFTYQLLLIQSSGDVKTNLDFNKNGLYLYRRFICFIVTVDAQYRLK